MQTLAGIIAIAALVCSARGAMNKDRVKPDISSTPSVDQQTPGASNNILSGEDLALYPTIGGSSTHPLSFTGNGNPVIRTGAASNAKSIPVNYAGIQPVAVNIEVSSTTTAIAVSVATVVATAVETVEAGAGHMAETEFSASTAIGSNRSIEIETPSTDPIILSNTNAFDFPPGAIKDSVEPFFGTAITTSPSILAVLGANETNDNAGGIGLGSPTLLSNNRPLEPTGKIRKRQAVTQNMPDGDSITFQTYAGEGFSQPQIVPVFEAVVDTTTISSSTITTDTSTTLTSGTTTITTTDLTSATATTTSTTTSWESPTVLPSITVVTEWSTTSMSTCIPAESHANAPSPPATCTDTTTLCTVTLAYVVSTNPTTTSYGTMPFDTAAIAGATATQTIYSEDPDGFHVHITTLTNGIGQATATYFFTTPQPTIANISQQSSNTALQTSHALFRAHAKWSIFSSFLLAIIL